MEKRENEQELFYEATRLLGRYSIFIRRSFFSRMAMMNAQGKTMMVSVLKGRKGEGTVPMPVLEKIERKRKMEAETRVEHYAQVAYIALRLARGIYKDDEELAQGIALSSLYHDYGQPPFGHNGEVAMSKASQEFRAGFRGHNIMGAMQILYDERDNIINAIKEGIKDEVVTETALKNIDEPEQTRYKELLEIIKQREIKMQKRVDEELAEGKTNEEIRKILDTEFDLKKVKQESEELKSIGTKIDKEKEKLKAELEKGKNYFLTREIRQRINSKRREIDEAVKVIAMTAGNHNGERGMEEAAPNKEINFEKFMKSCENTRMDRKFDKDMKASSMIEVISSVSDWLESVLSDVASGKEGGLQENIPLEYVKPFSEILGMDEDDIAEIFEGGNKKEIRKLILQAKQIVIGETIKNSDKEKITVGHASELISREGIRKITYEVYTPKTVSAEVEETINKTDIDTVGKLYKMLVTGENEEFSKELNDIFKLDNDDPYRKKQEKELLNKIESEEVKRFYKYVLTTSPAKYVEEKKVAKRLIKEMYKKDIESAIHRLDEGDNLVPVSGIGTKEYIIEYYILQNGGKEKIMEDLKMYDKEMGDIEEYMERIARFASIRHIETKNHKSIIDRQWDKRIAVSLASYYIERMDEYSYVELGQRLGTINNNQARILLEPYSGKIKNYRAESQRNAGEYYREGEKATKGNSNRKDSIEK